MAESTQNLPPLEQIRRIQQQPPTNWPLPDEYAIRIAQPLAKLPPDQAIKKAKEELAKLQKINDDLVLKLRDAEKFVADLKDSPITNLGGHGLRGLFLRWLMSIASNLRKDQYRKQRGRTMVGLDDSDLPAQDDPAAWLQESRELAWEAVYPPAGGGQRPVIDENFRAAGRVLANRRLVEAGYRLGRLLDGLLAGVPRGTDRPASNPGK